MTDQVCRKPTCTKPQADDSVFCEPHRDEKRRINAAWRARKAKDLPKQKPGRKPKGADAEAVVLQAFTQHQAAHAADSPAEPRIVNGRPFRPAELSGHALTVLDELIQQCEAELVMLRGTKEILERQ